jgi:hypothetical protein
MGLKILAIKHPKNSPGTARGSKKGNKVKNSEILTWIGP